MRYIKYTELPRKTKKQLSRLFVIDYSRGGLTLRESKKIKRNMCDIEVAKGNKLKSLSFSTYKNMAIIQFRFNETAKRIKDKAPFLS